MDTLDEVARDEWYSDLVEQISSEAVDQFTFDRMRSYYASHRDIAKRVVSVYREAETVAPVSPSAAAVMFTTATELGLKVTLLKPVIYGLVHNESVADLVSELAVKHNGLDRFKPLLSRLLAEYAEIDFATFTMTGHSKTLWEEFMLVQAARNGFVHGGQEISGDVAALAKEVAATVMGSFLVSTLAGLGLKLVKDGAIEDDPR
jgi:hypothetical protein